MALACETNADRKLSQEALVAAAVLAPSPDNNQPWRFVADGEDLHVCLDEARALPSDVANMFDLIAVGAAIENVVIRGRQAGWEVTLDFADGPADVAGERARYVATLRAASGGRRDPLAAVLKKRCTCRKLYSTRPLDADLLDRLSDESTAFRGVQCEWIADRPRIRRLARMVAAGDRFRFQYRPFHEEIFRQLRFSPAEAERTGDGLDVRTLELPPGAARLIAWLRPWRRMQRLNRLGLDRLLTAPSTLAVRKSGALGVITVDEPGREPFVAAGRAFQRIWLAATQEGLCLHPLGSIPVVLAHEEQLGGEKITPAHRKLARKLSQRLSELAPTADGRTLAMLFRIGYCSPPAVRSLRRGAADVLEDAGSPP